MANTPRDIQAIVDAVMIASPSPRWDDLDYRTRTYYEDLGNRRGFDARAAYEVDRHDTYARLGLTAD